MGIKSCMKRVLKPVSRFFARDAAAKIAEQSDSKLKELKDDLTDQNKALAEAVVASDTRIAEAIAGSTVEIIESVDRSVTRSAERDLSIEDRLGRIEDSLEKLLFEAGEGFSDLKQNSEKAWLSGKYANLEYFSKASFRKNGEKRVLLAGWYGANNLGDEYMLQTVIQHMSDEMLDRVSVLLVDSSSYHFGDLDARVNVLHYPTSLWDIDYLANEFDVLVWGGGALLDQNQYSQDPANVSTGNLLIWLSKRMLELDKDVYCLGLSGNATLNNGRYLSLLDDIVLKSQLFSLRDPYSFKVLEASGLNVGNVSHCEDIVFANVDLQLLKSSHIENSVEQPRVGMVFFSGFEDRFDEHLKLMNAVERYLSAEYSEYSIRLIPFYNNDDSDVLYLSRLRDRAVDCSRVELGSFECKLLSTPLADCNFVISGRYHAALISSALGIKTMIVCDGEHPHYPNKMAHLADLMNIKDSLVSMSALLSDLEGLIEGFFRSASKPSLSIEFLCDQQRWLAGVCSGIEEKLV